MPQPNSRQAPVPGRPQSTARVGVLSKAAQLPLSYLRPQLRVVRSVVERREQARCFICGGRIKEPDAFLLRGSPIHHACSYYRRPSEKDA